MQISYQTVPKKFGSTEKHYLHKPIYALELLSSSVSSALCCIAFLTGNLNYINQTWGKKTHFYIHFKALGSIQL